MRSFTIMLAMSALATVAVPAAAGVTSFEEQSARAEAARIFPQPLAGGENRLWFNYQTDVLEAKRELTTDLRHATDSEDMRDAWDEYRAELGDARRTYVKKLRKRGYQPAVVTVY
jgi:hypothetical protein